LLHLGGCSALCAGNFALCIQLHSLRVSFARVTMKDEVWSMASQSLELRFFHKLHKTIAVKDCWCGDNLFNKTKSIVVKFSTVGSSSWIMLWMPICSQQFTAFEHTKKTCICVSANRSQHTQDSSQGMPRVRRFTLVGKHWWLKFCY